MKSYHLYIASCVPDGGIFHVRLRDGVLTLLEKTPCPSPMFLDAAPEDVWAVLRCPFPGSRESALQRFPRDGRGVLGAPDKPIGTGGVVACHLCRYEGRVYAVNYLSGSVFRQDGALDVHEGTGVNPERQEAPHTHFIAPAPDGSCLLSTDLGLDEIFLYDGDLNVLGTAGVPAGHGARHLAYSEDGRTVFCANELASTVSVFRFEHGALTLLQTVPVLSTPNSGNTAAAIRVRGDYVYVSNRGNNSISCLRWDGKHLELCSETPCGGNWPRDFILVEDLLLCANEYGNCVTVLKVCGETLELLPQKLEIEAPLCIVALPEKE